MTANVQRDNQALKALYADQMRLRPTLEQMSKGYTPGDRAVRNLVEQQVMEGLDANQDGGVSFDELIRTGKAEPSAADLAARRAFFAQGDKDANGVLTLTELRATSLFDSDSLTALIGGQGADGVGDALVARADQDGDGRLSADEYARIAPDQVSGTGRFVLNKAGVYTAVWDMDTDAQIRAQDFARLDADKDGLLSAQEINARFEDRDDWRLDEAAPLTEVVDYVVAAADANGDGGASAEELAAAAAKAGLQDFDAASLLEDGDADHDGLFSKVEAQALRAGQEGHSLSEGKASAGQLSLNRLALAAKRGFGDALAADLGVLAAPPPKDPDASWTPYAAGAVLAPRDAAVMNVSNFVELTNVFDADEDGALSSEELTQAAEKAGLPSTDPTALLKALAGKDQKLDRDEITDLTSRWRKAAYEGQATRLEALSEGEASLANLLLGVQRGPRTLKA